MDATSLPSYPHRHCPGHPTPGSLADLRPPPGGWGLEFPVQMFVRSSVGRNHPRGLWEATLTRHFWWRLRFKAALGAEIQMGSNWPTSGSTGLVTPSWLLATNSNA